MNQRGTLKKTSYRCPICEDTGWILENMDNSQPKARPCVCIEESHIKKPWREAGINIETSNQTFRNFIPWNEPSKRAKEIAIRYFKDFEVIRKTRNNSILLCGQVGSGKTHLSIALGINLLRKNVRVMYMPYREIITKAKQNIMDEESYDKLITKYKSCEVLLLDDLFKGKPTPSDINIIFEIVNYRYLNHLPMIISSESMVSDLIKIDEAIGSRIYEMVRGYLVEIEKIGMEGNFRGQTPWI